MLYETSLQRPYLPEVIAFESFNLANGIKAFLDFFPKLFKATDPGFKKVEQVSAFKAPQETIVPGVKLTKDELWIVQELEKVPYTDMIKTRISVPEGFKGNYTEYFLNLQQAFAFHQDTLIPALQDFYILIASVITNSNSRLSQKDLVQQYKGLTKSREALNKDLSKSFQKTSSADQYYGDLFNSNEEVKELFVLRHLLIKQLENKDLQTVKELTLKIKDGLDSLITQAQSGSVSHLSAAQLNNLSEGAYEMAALVEFFAVNQYRARTATYSVEYSVSRLQQRLK